MSDHDGLLIVACVASVYLPFYLCYAVFLLTLAGVLHRHTLFKALAIPHIGWLYAFFALAAGVGALYRHWVGVLVLEVLFALVLLAFYVRYSMTEKIRLNSISVLVWGSLAAFGVAVVQKILDTDFRTTSLFVNANYYAYICELVTIVLVFALIQYGMKPLYWAAIVANIGGIFLSGCRSAWLAIFFGVLVVLLCLKKYRQLSVTAVFGAIALTLTFLLPGLLFPRIGTMKSDTNLRVLIWKTAIGYINAHPLFGQGMITYYLISTGRAHDTHAHNLFLDPLVNFGIIGTALLLVFLLFYLRGFIQKLRENPACAIALGVMTATFVHGFTDIPFVGAQTGPMLLLMLALAGGRKTESIPELPK